MLIIPNLRHLRAFVAVAHCGSVGHAALRIHITQPAVTQAIANLEALVGARLFDRRSTGSYLTNAGLILQRRVQRFFTMVEQSLLNCCPPGAAGNNHSVINTITNTQLRSLILTAEPANAAHAAKALGVSEATLYRSARGLEQILGCSLFQPTANGVVSTESGLELARKVGLAVKEIDYALREIRGAQGQTASQLALGVLPMSGSFALARAVNALTSKHPYCRVTIIEGPYLTLLKSLRAGEVDMNFGMVRKPEWACDVEELPFFDDNFCIVVRRNHPLTYLDHVTQEHLTQYEWVVPPPGTPRRRAVDECFSKGPSPDRFSIETSSTSVIRSLISNSDRVSVLSKHEVESEGSHLFTILPIKVGKPSVKGITMRADWLPTYIHSEFIEILKFYAASNTSGGAEPFSAPERKTA